MVGYDLDGTICERGKIDISYYNCKGLQRRAWKLARQEHLKSAKLIRIPKEKEYIIITSRKPINKQITVEWLEKNNLHPKELVLMEDYSRTRDNMILYKSEKINQYGLTRYYEDDEKISRQLSKKCPNTEIITVIPSIKEINLSYFIHSTLQI